MNSPTVSPCDLPIIHFGTQDESVHSCHSVDNNFCTKQICVRRSNNIMKNESLTDACSQHSTSHYCKFSACIGSDSDDDDDDDDDEEFREQCVEFLNWIDLQNSPMKSSSIHDRSTSLKCTNGLKSSQENSFEQKSPRILFSFYEPSSKSIKAVQELRTRKQCKD